MDKQGPDGMSKISGLLDPEARATLEAVFAKWAAPGMCNPDDQSPYVTGTPGQAAIQGDTRSLGQRNHDGLTAMGRAVLASGQLGRHNGLPCTIIVSTTLKELGSTEWIPPPHLDTGQHRINHYHHPEKYLLDDGNDAA